MVINKTCFLCGAQIPKEKIEEFESRYKAQESEIKQKLEENFNSKLELEKEKSLERIKQQKELFEDFKKTLQKQNEEERERIKKDFEEIHKKELENKEKENFSLKKELKKLEEERKKIEEDAEKKYKQKIDKLCKEKTEAIEESENQKEKIFKLKKQNSEEKEKLILDYENKIRKLENKTPGELGDEGQANVLDILIRNFPRDDIKETKKGKFGSDIFHNVIYNGENVGLIIYEVKNRSSWDNDWIDQVKRQRVEHKANYAILVSKRFPSKERIICEKNGVIIISPDKVSILAREIRNFLIEAHKSKLAGEEIEEKSKLLREYLTSSDYKNLLLDLFNTLKKCYELRNNEKRQHERHWAEEEKLNNRVNQHTSKIHAKIASIIENRKLPAIIEIKEKKSKKKRYIN